MSGPDMSTDVVAKGLGRYLSEQRGRPVVATNLVSSSAGARRGNVLFDAVDGDDTLGLVATIIPSSVDIEINPITAEAAIRDLAEANGVRVPHIHGVTTDPSYIGGQFFLSTRVDGESVPRRVLRLVHSEGIGERVAEQIGEALGHLHAIDPTLAPAALAPGDEGGNPAATALAELELRVSELVPNRPAFGLGLRWLERHLPGPPPRHTIIHSDVRNGNIMVNKDGLTAVLDWEGSRRSGDPMQDLAWPALRMWRFREDEREIGGFAGRDVFAAGYERAGGTFDEERFEWWKVEGTLRWGLGLAGQAAAHLDGRFSTIVMAASGRRVPELEWDLLMLLRPGK